MVPIVPQHQQAETTGEVVLQERGFGSKGVWKTSQHQEVKLKGEVAWGSKRHFPHVLLVACHVQGLRRLTASAMALFLAASLISYSWSAPQGHFQRRNWTPQAMLYLKGAQGRRFISDESQRKDLYDRLQLETRSQNSNPVSLSEAAALFLSSLWKAQEEGKCTCYFIL
ncbi:PREDICTED: spexin [Gavialis gangeticus]|uniref:spexin n=1 Tax=Gavialis gangeticus TaxID=94835 RepID=UPI00092E60D8|nr:PREDICTED: spexin [Gavialis gangeticus]